MAHIGTAVAAHLLHVVHDVADLLEVDDLDAGPLLREGEPFGDLVDADDAAGSHQPRRFRREQADGPEAVHHDGIAAADVAHLGAM
jgi:hypothetical protein